MSTDFDGACAGIRIRSYCNSLGQILFSMFIRVNIPACWDFKTPFLRICSFRFFSKRKHGFLGATTDKDFGIFADSDICTIISRTDIILNLNTITFDNILIRGPADAWRASPR